MSDAGYVSPFTDDLVAFPDGAVLLRRVPPDFIDWAQLDHEGNPRITSGAFQDYSAKKALEDFGLPGACMSVVDLAILEREGIQPSDLLAGFGPRHGFAALSAEALRDCHQGIQSDPRPGEPWHAVVFAKTKPKRDNTMKSCIAEAARWYVPPSARL